MNKVEFNLINNIAQINFNKLSTKNSLDRNDLKKITKFLNEIQNKSLDCLIISSVGNIFSSGMDFKEFSIGDWSKNPISEVCDLIENLPFISISLINGAVYGGSVELVISTDFRFGSKNCKIQIPASKYGIHYGHKGIKRCLNFFGLPISKKLLFFSEPIYLNDLKHINFKRIESYLNYPLVIKPINEGSSLDVYICKNKSSLSYNLKRMKSYNDILIEKFIPGREIQVAIMGNKILGAIELRPKREFYDYKAKYNSNAKTKHLIPVNISKKNHKKVNEIALKAHKLLKCRGITRSDFRFYKNKFYLLEINTQPGMTDLSLVPEVAAYRGIDFRSLIVWMIEDASKKR